MINFPAIICSAAIAIVALSGVAAANAQAFDALGGAGAEPMTESAMDGVTGKFIGPMVDLAHLRAQITPFAPQSGVFRGVLPRETPRVAPAPRTVQSPVIGNGGWILSKARPGVKVVPATSENRRIVLPANRLQTMRFATIGQ